MDRELGIRGTFCVKGLCRNLQQHTQFFKDVAHANAGFWTVQNFVRPLRFSLALAMAPAFDWFIKVIQERMHLSRYVVKFWGSIKYDVIVCSSVLFEGDVICVSLDNPIKVDASLYKD